jgi:branched-chain amino acid aminotransferase
MNGNERTNEMSDSITFVDGSWQEGNVPLFGSLDHATWLSSVVFDGARAFDGLIPDLDLHCQRAIASAETMGLAPPVGAEEIEALAREGVKKFPEGAALYIRPMFFGKDGFLVPDPESTKFALVIEIMEMPTTTGFSACLSPFRRPAPDTAPTAAKASCLYPNVARMVRDATARGFDNAVVLDLLGNVAEFATANLFIVKDGIAHTPVPNGTFLNGITRQRIIKLLGEAGIEVQERRLTFEEVRDADEVFSSGNYAKVSPANRIEDRNLQPGPVAKKAKELYMEFARSTAK